MKILKTIVFILSFFSLQMLNAQDNLVAYWSFDELVDNILHDESGNGHFATNYGASIVPGISGNALSFDGVDDYVRIPEDGQDPPIQIAKLEKGSISLWFKANTIPTSYGIAPILFFGAEEQCYFFDAANQGLIIELGHSPIYMGSEAIFYTTWRNGCTYPSMCFDSFTNVPKSVWHHYVVVVGDSFNTGYLDGVEMIDRYYNFGSSSDTQFFKHLVHEKMWLGKGYWDNDTQFFDGIIDELKIFNEPLTGSEVAELYNSGILSIKEGENSISEVRLYPNPAKDILHIDLSNSSKKIVSLKLININGQEVIKKTDFINELNIENLPSGLYLLGLTSKEKTYYKRFIIE